MKTDTSDRSYGYAFDAAFHEVLGDSCQGLSTSGNSASLVELCECLGTNYHPACACGLAQQIGRSTFSHLTRKSNGLSSLADQSFRLLPVRSRLKSGLVPLKVLLEDLFMIPVNLGESSDVFRLETKESRIPHALIPHLETGFIQEFVQWVSCGRPHSISVDTGSPGWTILVGKQPLET